jgi:hypothetical protein
MPLDRCPSDPKPRVATIGSGGVMSRTNSVDADMPGFDGHQPADLGSGLDIVDGGERQRLGNSVPPRCSCGCLRGRPIRAGAPLPAPSDAINARSSSTQADMSRDATRAEVANNANSRLPAERRLAAAVVVFAQ